MPLDHAVRALSDVERTARADLRAALGLLDARHLAGDPSVTLRLRTTVLAQWRRDARGRLPELRAMVAERPSRRGELAYASVPDLKESSGGLRDATVLDALVATWLVDVPHVDLDRSRRQLLDVRDALHTAAGRGTDRIAPELWPDLADALGLADAEAAQRHVRGVGRRVTHLVRLTWRRLDAAIGRPTGPAARRPALVTVARGVAVASGEVVLDRGTDPSRDPALLLRAAAEAAERDLVLAPASAARLARESVPLPAPWPRSARDLLVRLLAAGRGLLAVWETLDETGALELVLPEWRRVQLLPHASTVHRFTVDRHLLETCIEASALVGRVARPDVLMLAALLHDVGKAEHGDHSAAGAPVAEDVAGRLGLDEQEAALVGRLVRQHLLLGEMATGRDLTDPATTEGVAAAVGDVETLELLATLTEADARATGPQAWTPWRARLVAELVRRTREVLDPGLDGAPAPGPEEISAAKEVGVPPAVLVDPSRVEARLEQGTDAARLVVVSGDRVGLMAAVAGALATLRVGVRSARAWPLDELAVSVWDVEDTGPDVAVLRQQVQAVLDGRVDPARRLPRPARVGREPSVHVRPEASREATVLEVRVADRPGLVYLVCAALARLDLSVRSAHVATFGPRAVDVFYVQEPGAGALTDERAAAAAHAVRRALELPATLDD